MRSDDVHLGYIAEAITTIGEYLNDQTGVPDRITFYSDALRRNARLWLLETLADAASHLSEDLQRRHPEIPWRKIADFRNVLAHAYTDIDPDLVWGVIAVDLPALEAVVNEEMQE